ncbi:hypothetical protein Esti_005538 [Eimeria stiedai]
MAVLPLLSERRRKSADIMCLPFLNAALWALSVALLSSPRFAVTVVGVGQPQGSRGAESALFPPIYEHAFDDEGSEAAGSSQESLNSPSSSSSVVEAASSSDSSGESKALGESSLSFSTKSESADDQASSEASSDGGRLGEQHSLSPSGRTQEIEEHETHLARGAVGGGPASLVGEDQGSTLSSPGPEFFTWNPLKGDEPNEAESLKHEGTPEDFVSIPLLDELQGSADVTSTASVSTTSTARVQGGSGYQSRWQRDSLISPPRSPVEDSRWTRKVDQNRGGSSTPGDTSRSGSSGGQGNLNPPTSHTRTTTPAPRSPRRQRQAPEYGQTPAGGRSIWKWTDTSTPTTGRSRFTDSTRQNRYTLVPRNPNGDSSSSSRYQGRYTSSSPSYPDGNSTHLEDTEDEDITENKPECSVTVAGVEIITTYVDFHCSGEINVPYKSTSGSFAPRNMKVINRNDTPVTVVFKTVNATSSTQPTTSTRRHPSFLTMDGPASFLQDASDQEQEDALTDYVSDMLKEMRKHLRKHPDTPLDVVVSFSSPLDNPQIAAQSQSFMQTKEGGDRILQTCEELLSVLEERTNYTCEVLEAVDMVILRFPPTADVSEGGAVKKLLRKLLDIEGRSILFWELSKEASLQMIPVDHNLPTPSKPLAESPVFIQAKAELEQTCSAEATARSHLISGSSPLATRIPRDPDLQRRLWGLFAIKCVHAWLHGEMGHKDVVVAVVDSGVGSHIDLDSNAWRNRGEFSDGRDNDGNGFIDDVYGWNFADDSSRIDDQNGHGTHVAGTIGGVSNSYGIVGCSPYVALMKVQHFGKDGSGSIGCGVRGLAYAMTNGAHIINNSWGGPDATRSLQLIIERAAYLRDGLGVLIVNAAGNDGSNNDYVPVYPAQFDYPHTISVGSYSSDGSRSKFSNYGNRTVTLFAPGDQIYSTYFKSYSFLSGTSMATPHVSGVAALIFGVFVKSNSQVSAAEVKDIIKATLQPLRSAVGISQWGGAPDAMSAVLMARLGGMWCQMQCTDMLFDLAPEETHVPTLLVRGYREGTYSADLRVEVYSSSGRLLGQADTPFRLKSSHVSGTNYPSDAVAATAFTEYKKSITESSPLCDVQAKYHGVLGNSKEEGSNAVKITAIVLGCVAGVLLIAIGGFLLYMYLKKRRLEEGPMKGTTAKAGEQQQVGAEIALPEETSTAQEERELLADAS